MRVCASDGCGTLLSRYNQRRICAACEARPKPVVRVFVAWPRKPQLLETTCGGSAL